MNLLSTETSPYLRQHENNPVHWMPWGEMAFAKATREGKPVLLSIGYAACHWCHVMAHESFEDPHTAALMNRDFVCIKVDREERPDIDAIYQQSLALMGKQGGWPLTMFLTPDAKSFWGGTYFPPVAMQGLPAFRDVLAGIAQAWGHEREKITHNMNTLHEALGKLQAAVPGPRHLARQWLDQIADAMLQRIDKAHGGFGTAPKFPQLPALSFLWDYHIHSGQPELKAAVIQTLTGMCQGGIYDHIGGGIARYAVDDEWLIPHFEKMLPDNALFLSLLSEVWRETGNPLFAARAAQTIDFLKREMMVSHQGISAFASSLDADSDGAEGAYYTWSADEVESILKKDAPVFMENYDITRFGNWHEGGESVSIPNRLQSPAWQGHEIEETLAEQAAQLLDSRLKRNPPARDDKILADWNGLMIEALARAAFAFDMPSHLDLAAHVFRFVTQHMMTADHTLCHSFCEGKTGVPAMLDDYAAMGNAALALYQSTFEEKYLFLAKSWANILLSPLFYDENDGLFFMSGENGALLPLKLKPVDDGPVASGNATAAIFLARLGMISGDMSYAEKAGKIIESVSGDLSRGYFVRCGFLSAGLMLQYGLQLHVPRKFNDVLRRLSLPLACRLPAKTDKAEICTARHCLPPVTDAEELLDLLKREREKKILVSANDD